MVQKRENIQWAAVVWTKMPCWCQRRMGRLVRDDRKATVTQITTRYKGMQNTISERTTRRTLKQMGYSSRRPHRVLLLSAKNRKRRLQFAQAHQDWTIDWKKIGKRLPGLMSLNFLFQVLEVAIECICKPGLSLLKKITYFKLVALFCMSVNTNSLYIVMLYMNIPWLVSSHFICCWNTLKGFENGVHFVTQ